MTWERRYLDRLGYAYRGSVPTTDAIPYVRHWLNQWHADPMNYWRYVRDHVTWA